MEARVTIATVVVQGLHGRGPGGRTKLLEHGIYNYERRSRGFCSCFDQIVQSDFGLQF